MHLKLEVQSDLFMGAGTGSEQYAILPVSFASAL